MKKPKPPKKPRCFYKDWFHYILGIASPSLHFNLSFNPTPEAEEYFKAYEEYLNKLMLWKIENRICTREEWYAWYRYERQERRKLKAEQDFYAAMESLRDAARQVGELIAKAVCDAAEEINNRQ